MPTRSDSKPRVLVWGTYDLGKPRTRILLDGLRENGVDVTECHHSVWSGIEDKSQLRGWWARLGILLAWLKAYPLLLWRFVRLERHEIVVVPYMGHLDVLLLWPFAKLKGSRILWDVFLSLYDTVVEDRAMVSRRNPLAWLLYGSEWLATRAADRLLMDTRAHADSLKHRYGLLEKVGAVRVGAEPDRFPALAPLASRESSEPITVLFYGQFIALHGIPTVIDAARRLDDGTVRFVLIGKGQEEPGIRRDLEARPIDNLQWLPWVSYEELSGWIARADACLGIFGASEKAASVIPNKVFQVISSGRPLITRDSAAIRELLSGDEPGLYLVTPEDGEALVDAIRRFEKDRSELVGKPLFGEIRPRITTQAIGAELRAELDALRP